MTNPTDAGRPATTTQAGAPIASDAHSLTVGPEIGRAHV